METARVSDAVDAQRVPGSIEDLYIRHAPAMVRLAFLLTRDGALAEDVVQDAFVKVTGRFAHLRSLGAFDAYLRRTVINICVSHHRHAKVQRDYLARVGAHGQQAGRVVPEPDLETRDEVLAALAALPDRQRAVVVLRFYEDLSEQQVADALGTSAAAARSLLFRAMGTLRERLGGTENRVNEEEDAR